MAQLFGAFSLRIGEQEITLRSLKSRALLGYIALTPNLRESRERLVGLLWSESSESQAQPAHEDQRERSSWFFV